jgi:hypothetical protein
MAIVRDPATGRVYDDGRPSTSVLAPGAVAGAGLGLTFGSTVNPPQLPSYQTQGGRGDLQPTYAQRQADYAARAANYQPAALNPAAGREAMANALNVGRIAAAASQLVTPSGAIQSATGQTPTELATAAGQAAIGGLALPFAAGIEGVRNAAVRGLGGDVASLPEGGSAMTNAATRTLQQGAQQLGSAGSTALENAQTGLLGLLGAQRAAQPAAPAPTVPAQRPTISPADQGVLAQDRANLQAAVDRLNTNFDTWQVPQPPARTPVVAQAAQEPEAVQGDYNQRNTDMAAPRARQPGGAGLSFAMPQQPVAAPEPTARGGINVVSTGYTEDRRRFSDNPFERRAQREQDVLRSQEGIAAAQNDAALQRAQLAVQSEAQQAAMRGQLGLQEAALRGQYGLDAANVAGQYGLMQQQLSATDNMRLAQYQAQLQQDAAAVDPRAAEYAQNARMMALRTGLAEAQLQAGNYEGALQAAYGLQPAQPSQPTVKVLTGGLDQLPIGYTVDGRPVLDETLYRQAQRMTTPTAR